jgi:hypothetical protein
LIEFLSRLSDLDMSDPDRRLYARRGIRMRSCFNGHDVHPAQLRVVEIGTASIVVC